MLETRHRSGLLCFITPVVEEVHIIMGALWERWLAVLEGEEVVLVVSDGVYISMHIWDYPHGLCKSCHRGC